MSTSRPRGQQQLGRIDEIKVLIRWERLFRYDGNLRDLHLMELNIGRLLLVVGLVLLVIGNVAVFISTNFLFLVSMVAAVSPWNVVSWIGLILLVYAVYLLRNRERFDDSLADPDLNKLADVLQSGHQPAQIFMDDYCGYKFLEVLDAVYAAGENYPQVLIAEVLADPEVDQLWSRLGVDDDVSAELAALYQGDNMLNVFPTLLWASFATAWNLQSQYVSRLHVLLAILAERGRQVMLNHGITEDELAGLWAWVSNNERQKKYSRLWQQRAVLKPRGTVNRAYTSVYTPQLNHYAEDLTLQSASHKFELLIGREQIVNQLTMQLRKFTGTAALVVSEPGVGKTRLLKHLAAQMVVEQVPMELQDKRLVSFDFNTAFANLQDLDRFKSVLQDIIQEVAMSGDIVLVLEDLDQLLNIRSAASAEVMNLLVNGIGKYQIQVVATASVQSYSKYIQPNPALTNVFNVINLPAPQSQVSMQILLDEAPHLEQEYQVQITIEALKTLISIADRISHDRSMPAKGINILTDMCLAAQAQQLETIDEQFAGQYLSQLTGVSVGSITADESEKLVELEAEMHKRVVGQDEAITAVAAALRRARAGLSVDTKPIASFLFYGPTGVGKTEVAKTLAATYYGSEESMVRLDMSEYQEQSNLQRLIGEQVNGKFSGGYLTEPVRQRPYTLVLLDELEKANPQVLDLFLQVLDEGKLTDGLGRKVDFSNAIIIATSNVASKLIADQVAKGDEYQQVFTVTQPMLREVYRVEFLNRFNQIIMFKPLMTDEVAQIVRKFLDQLAERMQAQGIQISYSDAVVAELAQMAYDPVYGAREVSRVVTDQIENRVADLIVTGQAKSGSQLKLNKIDDIHVG